MDDVLVHFPKALQHSLQNQQYRSTDHFLETIQQHQKELGSIALPAGVPADFDQVRPVAHAQSVPERIRHCLTTIPSPLPPAAPPASVLRFSRM